MHAASTLEYAYCLFLYFKIDYEHITRSNPIFLSQNFMFNTFLLGACVYPFL